ncbi:MAG: hypothetical protein H0V01_09695 [Bacteroidetes bacterium]|nr:hypothetical protein [Bacteroidota bacterium]HET6243119.1 hypothetical protein [Bacteroidia bacterium]
MKKNYIFLLFGLLVFIMINSCSKDPGPGGRANVKGKLFSGNYHSPDVVLTAEDGEPDERIYLVYGEKENAYDKDVRTSHDGSFQFPFLRQGKYQIFAYSLDTVSESSSPMVPVIKSFEITDSKQQIEIDLTVFRAADKDGSSSIKGKVLVKKYNFNFSQILSQYNGSDEEVYLKFGNEPSFSKRIRTSYDGNYEFKGLRKGKYKVFSYSKAPSNSSPSGTVTVVMDVEITTNNQVINLADLVIAKN